MLDHLLLLTVALLMLALPLGGSAFTRRRLQAAILELNDANQRLQQERDNLALWIEDAKQREYIDLKTGIPNERKLEEDIFVFCREVESGKIDKFCITQIDLENFDQINTVASSRKGDIAIRIFARTVYRSMRRDEHMFRLNSPPTAGEPRENAVFRRQIGGDEFIFITKGPSNIALGFVRRLLEHLMPQYSREISTQLSLARPINLSLRAGIVELGRKEVMEIRTIEDARRHIDLAESRCYKAKQREHNLRAFWPGVIEQEHSSEITKTAAELTLTQTLYQLSNIEEELEKIRKEAATGTLDADARSAQTQLEERISRLKMDATTLLAFTYDKLPLSEEDRRYLYGLRGQ